MDSWFDLRVLLGRPGCIVMMQDFPDGLMVGKSPTPGTCLNCSDLVPPPPNPSFFNVYVILTTLYAVIVSWQQL